MVLKKETELHGRGIDFIKYHVMFLCRTDFPTLAKEKAACSVKIIHSLLLSRLPPAARGHDPGQ
jgi:hypothetical protein